LTAYRYLHDLRFPFYMNIIGDSPRKPFMASVLMRGTHLEYNIFNPVVSQIVLLNLFLYSEGALRAYELPVCPPCFSFQHALFEMDSASGNLFPKENTIA